MKEITAIVRPAVWVQTRKKLMDAGIGAFTQWRVQGRGKQKGLRPFEGSDPGIEFIPKRMVTLFLTDEQVETAVKILLESCRTGSIGDGKIFISPAEEAIRVRTGETGAVGG